jgi:hypothetical protein
MYRAEQLPKWQATNKPYQMATALPRCARPNLEHGWHGLSGFTRISIMTLTATLTCVCLKNW